MSTADIIVELLARLVLESKEHTKLLVALNEVVTPPVEEETTEGCAHPEEWQVSLATPHDPDHWVCAGCKYEHKGLTRN